MKQLITRIDDELHKQFKAAVAMNGENMTELVEQWVRQYVENHQRKSADGKEKSVVESFMSGRENATDVEYGETADVIFSEHGLQKTLRYFRGNAYVTVMITPEEFLQYQPYPTEWDKTDFEEIWETFLGLQNDLERFLRKTTGQETPQPDKQKQLDACYLALQQIKDQGLID